jgi:hypothetical protein
MICTCSKIPHIHAKPSALTFTVVTATKAIEVPSYEEGKALMQTIYGPCFLYMHSPVCREKGELMHLCNNKRPEPKLPAPRTEWDWYSLQDLNK